MGETIITRLFSANRCAKGEKEGGVVNSRQKRKKKRGKK